MNRRAYYDRHHGPRSQLEQVAALVALGLAAAILLLAVLH